MDDLFLESPLFSPENRDGKGFEEFDEFGKILITLFVVRINAQGKVKYFKMPFDVNSCISDEDSSLRQFKRKVLSKFQLGQNFKIFNSLGV